MSTWVALLRGVNVGGNKRVDKQQLTALCESLGLRNVRTVLNSGNAIFESSARSAARLASAIEAALVEREGFHANTVVLVAAQLAAIHAGNPLGAPDDPSRFLVAFPYGEGALEKARPLVQMAWEPDAIACTDAAVYLDARRGILQSPLVEAFSRATRDGFTTRNWATLEKLLAAAAR